MARKFVFVVTSIVFISKINLVSGVRCYSCSSNNDEKCVWNQSEEPSTITCNTGCVNAILPDASLFRGCLSDLPKEYAKEESCIKDLCNGGLFPPNRLACYHCAGPDCAHVTEIPQTDSQYCQKHVENDTCFTYVHTKSIILRGCVSDNAGITQTPRLNRKDCSRPYCNNEAAVRQITCWECDSSVQDELACKIGSETDGLLGKCVIDVLLGHEGFCYVWHEEEHVMRGCSNGTLDGIDKKYMKTCGVSLCNDQSSIITHCLQCNSKINSDCKDLHESGLMMERCPEKTSSCHACRDFENVVQRGCGQPEQCVEGCFSCWNGSLCNTNRMFECFLCDSSIDPQCELLLNPDIVDKEICNIGCEVKLIDGILYRGCIDENNHCSDNNFCSRCYQDNCNNFYIDSTCGIVKYMNNEDELDLVEE